MRQRQTGSVSRRRLCLAAFGRSARFVAGGVGVLALAIALAGCAMPAPQSASSPPTPTPTPTPTAACPQVEGAELPPECAPYDPDQSMAQNERYRDRMEISVQAAAALEGHVEPLLAAMEGLRSSGAFSEQTVTRALAEAGLPHPQVREDYGDVLFGVAGPEGGCLFGAVTAEAVSVEIGGYIMDGGCLPAQ